MHEGINVDHFLKTGSVEAEETWTDRLSRTSDALNEKYREVANGFDVFSQWCIYDCRGGSK